MSNNCRTCDAEIIWAHTETGKRMPLDAKPVENGNVVLDYADGRPVARVVPPDGEVRYVSHFSTCPYAQQHRGGS